MSSSPPPNRLVALLRSVMGNAAWDAIKNIARLAYDHWPLVVLIMGAIGTGLNTLLNRLRGIPSDLVGVLIVFGVVVFIALLVFVIGKLRDRRGTAATSIEGDQQIDTPKPEPSVTVQASSAQCQYELVHRIADHQAKNIRDFVTVSRVAVWEHKLKDPVPTIKWGFMIDNRSLFPVNLVEVRNNLFFETTELAERRFETHNEVQQLGYWRDGSVIFEQRLSGPEAQYIKNTPDGKFRFNRLKILVGNHNNSRVIAPQQLEITDDLETTLDKITYKVTEGMESLRKERDWLRCELENAKGAKSKLIFEVDQHSQVNATGGGTAGRRIQASIRLRCMKVTEHAMAIKEFHASLIKQGEPEQIVVAEESALVVMSYPDMKTVDFRDGWTISEPLTGYRWFMFYLDLTEQQLQRLSPDYFIRVTMNAIGQRPVSIDIGVNNWQDARTSNSDITVRGKAG